VVQELRHETETGSDLCVLIGGSGVAITQSPVLDLAGYTQVAATNVGFTPASASTLTINSAASITAASSTKTITEVLLFQAVSDPTDVPLLSVTQSPFSIQFTPTRLGSTIFTAVAVFTDGTYTTTTLNYNFAPSGSPLDVRLPNPPIAALGIGQNVTVDAIADFSNGPVDVTSAAAYTARSGGTNVFSFGTNGSITATGNGSDWLDVTYQGLVGSALISVGQCTNTLTPTNQIADYGGASVSIQVTTQTGCAWTASSESAWLTFSQASGSGSAVLTATAAPNASGSQRVANITVGNAIASIIQPATSCSYAPSPTTISIPSGGGSGTISVTTSCPFTSSSDESWATATTLSQSSVAYYVAANSSAQPRTATLSIGTSQMTLTQAGAPVAPTITVMPSATSITTIQALSVTVAVGGTPTPTGSVTLSSGSYTSAATTLVSGSAQINIPAGSLATGSDTLTASYTPDSNSSSIYNGATGTTSSPITVTKATPAVTVTSGSSSITTTQALSVTVAVSGGSGAPAATGTVTFTGGGYTSAATSLVGGSATINVPSGSLAVGNDTLTAIYTGDSNYTSAPGSSSPVTVTKATPTVMVSPFPSSITTVQGLTVTIAVSGGSGNPAATGSVTLTSGSYTSASTALSSGSATITVPAGALAAGSDTLTASYTGDSNYSANMGASPTVTVTKVTPTVTVTPSPASITTVQSLSVTVAVNGGSGNPTPTGSVTLTGGGYMSAATSLVSGSATITVPASSLAAGNDTLTVTYTPDASSSFTYNGALNTASETVTRLTPAVSVTPSLASITTVQSLSVTVAVDGGSGNPTATGTVTLTGGGYTSAVTSLVGGSASITVPAGSLAAGSETLTASYTGDSNYSVNTGASPTVTVTKATPSVTVTPSPSSITTVQGLTVTVAVSGGSGNPTATGSVTLNSGSYTSAATTLSGGSATITVPAASLAVGSETLTASYTPDSSSSSIYNSSSGSSSPVTVTKTTPTVSVTPTPASITTAQTLSVMVAVSGGSGNPTPTGTVTLGGGGYTSTATSLASGSATITVPAASLAVGSDTLTASYTPDSSSSSIYNSSSGTNSVTVNLPPSFTLSPSAGNVTVIQGNSGTNTITVTGANGFTGAVTLAATGLPAGVTAGFATNPTTASSVLTLTASNTATVGGAGDGDHHRNLRGTR